MTASALTLLAGAPVAENGAMQESNFVGREDALRDALAGLAATRFVTLKGAPGVGKSRLARAVSEVLRARGERVVTVTCEGEPPLRAIATACREVVRGDDEELLVDHLAARFEVKPTVLIVDGRRAGSRDVRDVLVALHAASEQLCVLVCAWQSLELNQETLVSLEPLPLDASLELLRRVRGTAAQLEVLAKWAGGLPLALELVAGRASALGIDVTLSHLTLGEPLRASIGAAFDSLSDEEQRALCSLSVFNATWSSPLALAVMGDDAIDALARLTQMSLVHGSQLLDTVRDFARREASSDVLHAARARLARALMTQTGERADLLDAWQWAIDTGENEIAVALAVRLDPILVTEGPLALHRRVLETTLPLNEGIDVRLALGRLEALRGSHRAALVHFELARENGWACALACHSLGPLGRTAEALALGNRALELARTNRDLRLAASAESALATVERDISLPDAIRRARRSVAAARLADAPRLLGIAFANLGECLLKSGAFNEAATAFREARAALEAANDTFHLSWLACDELVLDARMGAAPLEERLAETLAAARVSGAVEGELKLRELSVELAQLRGDATAVRERLDALEVVARLQDDVRWLPRVERLRAIRLAERPLSLRLSRDGAEVWFQGERYDFRRRGPLRRVLLALVDAHLSGRALASHEVQAAGWPDERLIPHSASQRVYMAIRRLRSLGLGSAIVTTADGYRLASEVDAAFA